MQQNRTSRRAVTKAALWAAPAVAVVSATPAHADSAQRLTFSPGATRLEPLPLDAVTYYNLLFDGATVTAVGAGIDAGQLRMTVTMTPAPLGGASDDYLFEYETPAGWTVSPDGDPSAVNTYTFTGSVPAGSSVPLDGLFFGANHYMEHGTFVITFAAPGFGDVPVNYSFTAAGPSTNRAKQLTRAQALRSVRRSEG